MQQRGVRAGDSVCESDYAPITCLRLLALRQEQPTVWDRLCLLEHHSQERRQEEGELWEYHQEHVVNFLIKKLGVSLSDSEIHDVLGRMFTNCGDLQLPQAGYGRGCGFYPTYANMNHSCICNTKTLKFSSDQRLEVRAQVSILAGEEISTQYLHSTRATYARRPLLRSKWYFDCSCARCQDAEECGALLAALSCTGALGRGVACGGAVLPLHPLQGESSWQCRECAATISAEEVMARLEEVARVTGEAVEGEDSIIHWERVLHLTSSTLQPSHYLAIEVKEKLAILYGNMASYKLPEMSRPMKERKIQLCQDMLDVISIVDPGYTKTRGQMLSEMNRTKMAVVKEDLAHDTQPERKALNQKRWDGVCLERQFLQMYLAFYQSLFLGKLQK